MSKVKQIPCKVCGKMFTPCAWCQGANGSLSWRAFACSLECGKAYVAKAIKYNKEQAAKALEETETAKKKTKKTTTKKVQKVEEVSVEETNIAEDKEEVQSTPTEDKPVEEAETTNSDSENENASTVLVEDTAAD